MGLGQNRNSVKKCCFHKHPEKAVTDTVTEEALPSAFHYLRVSVAKKTAGLITKQTPSCSEESGLPLCNLLFLSWAARQNPCERFLSWRAPAASCLCVFVLVGSQCAAARTSAWGLLYRLGFNSNQTQICGQKRLCEPWFVHKPCLLMHLPIKFATN